MKLWETFMVICASVVDVVMNGLSDLRTVRSQHMISCVWDDPEHHVTMLTLHKIVKSSVLIVV
jgi:hypothetical protein